MRLLVVLAISVFASDEKETAGNSEPKILNNSAQNSILVKIEEDECVKKRTNYFGVSYIEKYGTWRVWRWSKDKNKNVYNGRYEYEETAAYASDTLARKLISNGEKGHKLNFPDDDNEVYAEETKKKSSDYIGVTYESNTSKWRTERWSKYEKKNVYNGSYKDEETAAHASDTLARKLIANGEQDHKLNYPDDDTEVYPEKASSHLGVIYNKKEGTWRAQRWSKEKNKTVYNGTYKDEETAAHASDTLARKLIANGEKSHKANFPDDDTEVYPENQNNKRKRPFNF